MKNILIVNDDGIYAPGLRKLIDIAKEFGNITIVAPDRPRSGVGHAITLATPLRLQEIKKETNYREYMCNGTPVDCVKIGLKILFEDKNPDLVLSGINHGSNASSNVIYSGTMGAAIEAGIENIPAIGFSLLDYSHNANFNHSELYIKKIIEKVLSEGLPPHIALNVNIPNVPRNELQGIKICKQADAYWEERYERRKDPYQVEYYWLNGDFIGNDQEEGTDLKVLKDNYISIVPIQYDLTAHNVINNLKQHFE